MPSNGDWAGLPVTATGARPVCRELTVQDEYLRVESRFLKEKIPGRLRFTDKERRPLTRMSSARETALRAFGGTNEFLDSASASDEQRRAAIGA